MSSSKRRQASPHSRGKSPAKGGRSSSRSQDDSSSEGGDFGMEMRDGSHLHKHGEADFGMTLRDGMHLHEAPYVPQKHHEAHLHKPKDYDKSHFDLGLLDKDLHQAVEASGASSSANAGANSAEGSGSVNKIMDKTWSFFDWRKHEKHSEAWYGFITFLRCLFLVVVLSVVISPFSNSNTGTLGGSATGLSGSLSGQGLSQSHTHTDGLSDPDSNATGTVGTLTLTAPACDPSIPAEVLSLEQHLRTLAAELKDAVDASKAEKERATSLLNTHRSTIDTLASGLQQLSDRHDQLSTLRGEKSKFHGSHGFEGEKAMAGAASTADITHTNSNTDNNSNGQTEGKAEAVLILESFRSDVEKLSVQVQGLADTEKMIEQFNVHAANLNKRSVELEGLISSRTGTTNTHTGNGNGSVGQAGTVSVDVDVDGVGTSVDGTDPDSSTGTGSQKGESGSCQCDGDGASTKNNLNNMNIGDGADLVNMEMARELIGDIVQRQCNVRLDEVNRAHAEKISQLKEAFDACDATGNYLDFGDNGASKELLDSHAQVLSHNTRVDFASANADANSNSNSGGLWLSNSKSKSKSRARAKVDYSETSRTFVPPQWNVADNVRGSLVEWGGSLHPGGKAGVRELVYSSGGIARNAFSALQNGVLGLADVLGLDKGVGTPEDALNSDMSLGSCWPFPGDKGHLTIDLAHAVQVSAIAIDHVSRNEAININSAPREFRVYGMSGKGPLAKRQLLVEGSYSLESGALFSQTFEVDAKLIEEIGPIQSVRVEVMSNHGNEHFTCLYRVRVFGEPIAN